MRAGGCGRFPPRHRGSTRTRWLSTAATAASDASQRQQARNLLSTPHGARSRACVLSVPSGTAVRELAPDMVELHFPNGTRAAHNASGCAAPPPLRRGAQLPAGPAAPGAGAGGKIPPFSGWKLSS